MPQSTYSLELFQAKILNSQQKLKDLLENFCGFQCNDAWDWIDTRHEIHHQCATLYHTSFGYITGIAAWKGDIFAKMAVENNDYLYEELKSVDGLNSIFRVYRFPMDPMILDLKLAIRPETYLHRSIWARKNDQSVKSLFADHCTSPHSTDQIGIMILRYRPCMSCTLKITSANNGKSSSNIISKVYSDKHVIHRVNRVMKQLYGKQKNAGVSYFAWPITTIPNKNILIQDFVSGKSLEILIANALTGKKPRLVDAKSAFEKCGKAIRFVHCCKIKVSKQRSLLTEWSELNQKACDILDINQNIGIKLLELSTLLKETYTFDDASQESVLTHGDFKPGQILVDRLGVRLLDFDNVALSEPEFDIGTFIATLKQTYLKAMAFSCNIPIQYRKQVTENYIGYFLQGYFQGRKWPAGKMTWCLSLALLRKAIREFYKDYKSKIIEPMVQEAVQSLSIMDCRKIHLV